MTTTQEDTRNRELASRVDGLVRDAAQEATRATGLSLTQFAKLYQSGGSVGKPRPQTNPPPQKAQDH